MTSPSAYVHCGEAVCKARVVYLFHLDPGKGQKLEKVKVGGGEREEKYSWERARGLGVCKVTCENHPKGGSIIIIKIERHMEEKSGHRSGRGERGERQNLSGETNRVI